MVDFHHRYMRGPPAPTIRRRGPVALSEQPNSLPMRRRPASRAFLSLVRCSNCSSELSCSNARIGGKLPNFKRNQSIVSERGRFEGDAYVLVRSSALRCCVGCCLARVDLLRGSEGRG